MYEKRENTVLISQGNGTGFTTSLVDRSSFSRIQTFQVGGEWEFLVSLFPIQISRALALGITLIALGARALRPHKFALRPSTSYVYGDTRAGSLDVSAPVLSTLSAAIIDQMSLSHPKIIRALLVIHTVCGPEW